MEYQSAEIDKIAEAMAAAQGEFDAAEKNAKNPHLKNRYADLGAVWDAVRDVLPKHGLSVVQTMRHTEDGRATVHTMLMHKSGQWIAGLCALPVPKNDPQGFGSAYTYARRYSLSAMLGVVSEDDDDGEGAKRKQQAQPQAQARPQEQPYNLEGIKARMGEMQTVAAITDYLRGLTIPEGHSQRPAITKLYMDRKAQLDFASPLPSSPTGPTTAAPITDDQRKYIQAHFNGWERDKRLSNLSDFLRRKIESVNDMTKDEASAFIDAVESEKETAHA